MNRRSAPKGRTHTLRGSGMEDELPSRAHPNIPPIPDIPGGCFWHVIVHSRIGTYPVRPVLAR
jgi:hypothetical protein